MFLDIVTLWVLRTYIFLLTKHVYRHTFLYYTLSCFTYMVFFFFTNWSIMATLHLASLYVPTYRQPRLGSLGEEMRGCTWVNPLLELHCAPARQNCSRACTGRALGSTSLGCSSQRKAGEETPKSHKSPNLVSPVINQRRVKWEIKPVLWEALKRTHGKSWVKLTFWLICSVQLRQSGYWKTGKWLRG